MKNIYYLLPLILISCSQNEVVEVGVKDLNYRNGLFYEINASQPFNGIFTSVWTSGSRNGGTSKVLIKNGVPVSGQEFWKNSQLRLVYEVLNTYKNRGSTKAYTSWQIKITECYHKDGSLCSDSLQFYKPNGLPYSGSVSNLIGSNYFFYEETRIYYGVGMFEIVKNNPHRILSKPDTTSLYCASGNVDENFNVCDL